MKPLPMPLRLAAGLVATAIEEVQELPRKLVELPVTAVSQVLQASMRMQQRVTELAIKGDQALGGLRSVPEAPPWARFDEDEMDPPFGGGGGPFAGGSDHPFGVGIDRSYGGGNGVTGAASDAGWNVPPPRSAPRTVSPIRIARDPEPAGSAQLGDNVEDDDLEDDDSESPALTPVSGPDTRAVPPGPATAPPAKPASKKSKPAADSSAGSATRTAEAVKPGKATSKPPAKGKATKPGARASIETGPEGLEDYPTWTLPQLRGRFRSLELTDVQTLLTWETTHLDRPPYVTMLSNRIASITSR